MQDTPRRKRRPSKRRRPALWRRALYTAARLSLWGVAAVLLAMFVVKVWHPYGLNQKVSRDITQTRAQLEATRKDNARQERRIKYLQTPEGQAAQARRLGYHFPGEIPLRLQEPTPPPTPAAPAPK
jgi:cell division protein FtsB